MSEAMDPNQLNLEAPTGPAIFRAMGEVMKNMVAIGKDKRNTQQGFNFRGIDDAYNVMHPILSRAGIFTVPLITDEIREQRQTKSGGVSNHLVLRVTYRFYSTVDGSYVEAHVAGEANDTGDKATSKAMSIAHKYALLQVFAVPTKDVDDPDHESPEETKAPEKPKAKVEKPAAPTPPPSKPVGATGAEYVAKIAGVGKRRGIPPNLLKDFIRGCYPKENMANLTPRATEEIMSFLDVEAITHAEIQAEIQRCAQTPK